MKSISPDLSIIIVTYRSEEHIGRLLDSLASAKGNLKLETIVVDNYLADKSLDIAALHKLRPKTFASPGNVGFSKAVNFCLKKCHAPYIFLINPDCTVFPSTLTKLFQFAKETPHLGAVVPRLLNRNNRSQPSVFHLPSIANAVKAYFFNQKEYFGKYLPKENTPVEAAVMAAMLIPKTTLDKVGFLDERYFLYYEDLDFCARLKKHSLPLIYLSGAKVKHLHGASGEFTSHLHSPLAKSSQIYHGEIYSKLLNIILWIGQKWQKFISLKWLSSV